MPFGFEQRMQENQDKSSEENYHREYIDVIALMDKDGKITPLNFIWKDGRSFRINKVLCCHNGRSLKYYTKGLRFRCRCVQTDFYLYFDEEKWYVEISKAKSACVL